MKIFKNKRLFVIGILVMLILSVPLIAMQFTKEVNWTTFDFIVAGTLLLVTGLSIEIVIRKAKKSNYKLLFVLFILLLLSFIWLELSVGMVGSRFGVS